MKLAQNIPIIMFIAFLGLSASDKLSGENEALKGDDDVVPKFEDVKIGTDSFYRLPSGLEVVWLCGQENDTLIIKHPKRKTITFFATKEKVKSFQIVESAEDVRVTHIDANGDGIPESEISEKDPDDLEVRKLKVIVD